MNKFIEQVINETFRSKRQQRYFYAKADDPNETPYERDKWKKRAEEFSSKTDFDKLPETAEEQEKEVDEMTTEVQEIPTDVAEIVDADGNIKTGDDPGNPNAYIRSKKTSDEVAKATMGQMGSFGVLGGNTSGNKTLKYWAESDMSKALGAKDTIMNPKVDNYDDAVDKFEDELEIPGEEAKDRAAKLGYDPELPDGKIRLIENPKKYIEEYLAKRTRNAEIVPKTELEHQKKVISPIIRRQLGSIKQSLKDNNLTVKDITEYLEDNE
jgi:hypothetical protein